MEKVYLVIITEENADESDIKTYEIYSSYDLALKACIQKIESKLNQKLNRIDKDYSRSRKAERDLRHRDCLASLVKEISLEEVENILIYGHDLNEWLVIKEIEVDKVEELSK